MKSAIRITVSLAILASNTNAVKHQRKLPKNENSQEQQHEEHEEQEEQTTNNLRKLGKKSSKSTKNGAKSSKTTKKAKALAAASARNRRIGAAPPLPGVAPGIDRPKVILTGDIDYPPYSFLGDASTAFAMDGFGPDFARGLMEVCDIDVFVGQANWADCWGDNQIGTGLADGWYHGCTTYTHTAGVRNRYLEFSTSILNDNAPAGILTRLDGNGEPEVDGLSNLNGLRVVDVIGWAPTADTLALVTNPCTGQMMEGYELVAPTQEGQANDAALLTLLAGDADVMWVYAGQAEIYSCANLPDNEDVPYDCTLWDGLGTDFAYIQTGIYEHALGGTTLSISKLGSGLKDILDPCIEEFIQTESYFNLCEKHGLTELCFRNEFFGSAGTATPVFNIPTLELTTSCSDGYCSCPPQ